MLCSSLLSREGGSILEITKRNSGSSVFWHGGGGTGGFSQQRLITSHLLGGDSGHASLSLHGKNNKTGKVEVMLPTELSA